MITLNDSTFRPQLHANLLAVFPDLAGRINDDVQRAMPGKGDLPRAFVTLGDPKPDYRGEQASFSEVQISYPYTLLVEFAWPASGTIEAARLTALQALLAQLTASPRYCDRVFRIIDIRLVSTDNKEPNEPTFGFAVEITIEDTSDR